MEVNGSNEKVLIKMVKHGCVCVCSAGGSSCLRSCFLCGLVYVMESLFQSSCSSSQTVDGGPAGKTRVPVVTKSLLKTSEGDTTETFTVLHRNIFLLNTKWIALSSVLLLFVVCSLSQGLVIQMPPAAVLICAASMHGAYRGCEEQQQSFSDVLNALKPETEAKHQQVLVSLLFLCMRDYLSGLLYPQGKSFEKSKYFCSELLTLLVNSTDWLLIFRSN
ncbi:hypothetical protein GOODEAATRI_031929, partial [Goodea atripinnis]